MLPPLSWQRFTVHCRLCGSRSISSFVARTTTLDLKVRPVMRPAFLLLWAVGVGTGASAVTHLNGRGYFASSIGAAVLVLGGLVADRLADKKSARPARFIANGIRAKSSGFFSC